MARLVFGMNLSLDGYVDHEAFAPDPVLFRQWIEQVAGTSGSLYGRRLYEIMHYWDEDQPDWGADERAFAEAWRRMPKWVVSRSLKTVGPNATLIRGDVEAAERPRPLRQQQLPQAEGDRPGELDLDRPQNVLPPGSEQHERDQRDRGRPGPHATTHHHRPQQHGDRTVDGHRQGLELPVGVEPGPGPQAGERQPGQQDPVAVDVLEQRIAPGDGLVGQHEPVVAREPAGPGHEDQQVGAARHHQRPGRPASPRIVGTDRTDRTDRIDRIARGPVVTHHGSERRSPRPRRRGATAGP